MKELRYLLRFWGTHLNAIVVNLFIQGPAPGRYTKPF